MSDTFYTETERSFAATPKHAESWWYRNAGVSIGPVTEEQMHALVSGKVIDRSTMVWRDEFGQDWKRLDETALWKGPSGPPAFERPVSPRWQKAFATAAAMEGARFAVNRTGTRRSIGQRLKVGCALFSTVVAAVTILSVSAAYAAQPQDNAGENGPFTFGTWQNQFVGQCDLTKAFYQYSEGHVQSCRNSAACLRSDAASIIEETVFKKLPDGSFSRDIMRDDQVLFTALYRKISASEVAYLGAKNVNQDLIANGFNLKIIHRYGGEILSTLADDLAASEDLSVLEAGAEARGKFLQSIDTKSTIKRCGSSITLPRSAAISTTVASSTPTDSMPTEPGLPWDVESNTDPMSAEKSYYAALPEISMTNGAFAFRCTNGNVLELAFGVRDDDGSLSSINFPSFQIKFGSQPIKEGNAMKVASKGGMVLFQAVNENYESQIKDGQPFYIRFNVGRRVHTLKYVASGTDSALAPIKSCRK